jgi:response regulator RpfG family c-di-GMP phosphodiesterase
MKPRVLIAAADRATWRTHLAALAGDIEAVFAATARETMEKLAKHGPFGVLVAELRVPGMSGVDLLNAVRQNFPDTGRLLVVNADDRESAIEAINRAHVHAFFVEPFSSVVFADAVWAGVTEHQRTLHERAVMLQTAEGIVQLLSGLVHPLIPIPPLSEAAQRMRDRVRFVAQAMKLPTVADLEAAALLSRVGLAAVPRHILEKILTHEKLSVADHEFLARLPDVGLRLVEHQPRFAGVAEIFRHQGADPGPMIVRDDGLREHRVPLAARILRAVVDLQLHENAGLTAAGALAEMRKQSVHYDTTVLKAFELLFAGQFPNANGTFEECMVADLIVGSVLATEAVSDEGVPLVSAGTTITSQVLERLRNFADLGEIVEPLYVIRTAPRPEEEQKEA